MGKLYLLAGPTASGKTDYAIEWALKKNCEILSCDTSAIYKYLNIGTAKPTHEQQQWVPHWGINLVHPKQNFSVHDYLIYALNKVKEIQKRGKDVLVVGGSGFYLKCFLGPVVDTLSIPATLVEQVIRWEKKEGVEGLLKRLNFLNPDGFPENFDSHNVLKVRKGLERCLASGLSLKTLKHTFENSENPFLGLEKESLLVVRPTEILRQRARIRTRSMLNNGLIEEVGYLLSKKDCLNEDSPASKAIGYRETIAYLKKTIKGLESRKDLEESIVNNTFALIKKQNTWFRYQIKFDRYLYL